MFGRRADSAQGKKLEMFIGKDTRVEGRLEASGSVRIDGCMDGEVEAEGDVIIGDSGRLTASIRARNVTIAGEVKGNIYAGQRLEIVSTGKLLGDVKVAALVVEDGAVFKGTCEMVACGEAPKLLPGGVEKVDPPQDEDTEGE